MLSPASAIAHVPLFQHQEDTLISRAIGRWTPRVTATLALAVAVSSCATVSKNTTTTPSLSLSGTTWRIVEVGGVAVADPAQTEFNLDASGGVSVNTGCNTYTGSATVSGKKLTISPLATTRKACTPPLQTQETAILGALKSVREYESGERGQVNLLDDDDRVVIRLAPQNP